MANLGHNRAIVQAFIDSLTDVQRAQLASLHKGTYFSTLECYEELIAKANQIAPDSRTRMLADGWLLLNNMVGIHD